MIVGDVDDLICEEFEIDRVNWICDVAQSINGAASSREPGVAGAPPSMVKIRYSHPGTAATVIRLENNRARIRLHKPQRAVTPGQAAVIYDRDIVLGGGWICRQEALAPA